MDRRKRSVVPPGSGGTPPVHPLGPPRSRIYLLDDQTIFREGLRELLGHDRDLEVSGEAGSPERALLEIPLVRPDLVITEISFAGRSRLDLLPDLRGGNPALPILVLSVLDEVLFAKRALMGGAKGYIMKYQTTGELKAAIGQVIRGGYYLGRSLLDRLGYPSEPFLDRLKFTPLHPLSDREMEVYELIGTGLGTRDISRSLRVHVKVVESYQSRIMEKLDLRNAGELLRRAIASIHGVATPVV